MKYISFWLKSGRSEAFNKAAELHPIATATTVHRISFVHSVDLYRRARQNTRTGAVLYIDCCICWLVCMNYICLSSRLPFLPRDAYAARYIMTGCPSVCLFVCHKPVIYQNGWMEIGYLQLIQHCVMREFGYHQNKGTSLWGLTWSIFAARSELRKVLFLVPSVCVFCLCVKYLGNRWTDLRQIHTEDVFGPLLERVWRSRLKVKGQGLQGQKRHFPALSAACVWFIFGKTSLASTLCLKKVPTCKLCVTLSNLNRFFKKMHCWKAYEICYKTYTTLPTSL